MRRLELVKILVEVLVRKHEQELEASVEGLDAVCDEKSFIVSLPNRHFLIFFTLYSFLLSLLWFLFVNTLEVVAFFVFFQLCGHSFLNFNSVYP